MEFNYKKRIAIIGLLIAGLFVSFTISISLPLLPLQEVSARCPNGYHKSPSGVVKKLLIPKECHVVQMDIIEVRMVIVNA